MRGVLDHPGGFWDSVAAWCAQTGMSPESSDKLLPVRNENLRAVIWTASRTLPTGGMLALAEAVLYEKAGGAPIPGYNHIAVALNSSGPN